MTSLPSGWATRFIFFPTATAPVTLFAYDTKTKSVKQAVENKGLDFKSLSAGPDALVYEQFGGIYLFDPQKGAAKKVDIHIAGDLPATRPHFEKVARQNYRTPLSPQPARARSLKRAAKSSPCPRKRATPEIFTRTAGSSGTRSVLVAGRQVDRIFFRRVRRVRAAPGGSVRVGDGKKNRSGQTRHLSSTARRGRQTARKLPLPTSA